MKPYKRGEEGRKKGKRKANHATTLSMGWESLLSPWSWTCLFHSKPHQQSSAWWNEKDLPRKGREGKKETKNPNKTQTKPRKQTKTKKPSRRAVCLQPALWSCTASRSPSTSLKGLTTSVQHRNLFIAVGGRNLSERGSQAGSPLPLQPAGSLPTSPNIKDTVYI